MDNFDEIFKSIEDKEADMIWYQQKYDESIAKFGRRLERSNSCNDIYFNLFIIIFLFS